MAAAAALCYASVPTGEPSVLDNLALLFVHGALAVLVLRIIRTPDPDDADKPRPKPTNRFRRPD